MARVVLVGIDAGGTSTVLRASVDGREVFAGASGPANATSTPAELLERHILASADGCPDAVRVAACFAGLSNEAARSSVRRILRRRFPTSELRLAPDYVAVALASEAADVVAIAGTGSVCCSFVGGRLVSSGGLGYLIGDHGSGFRYGQAFVDHVLTDYSSNVPAVAWRALEAELGTARRREIVDLVHRAEAPAELLARFARTLGDCADRSHPWALGLVDVEAFRFARTVALHIGRHIDKPGVVVDLAGGVWRSRAIRNAFTRHLTRLLEDRDLTVAPATNHPVAGALRLARLPDAQCHQLCHVDRASVDGRADGH
jgi:N-acetylglucosamine kinase-like BadF-type ATPase